MHTAPLLALPCIAIWPYGCNALQVLFVWLVGSPHDGHQHAFPLSNHAVSSTSQSTHVHGNHHCEQTRSKSTAFA